MPPSVGRRDSSTGREVRARDPVLPCEPGAALGAIGETVDEVERRLAAIALAYGLPDARFSVFPTSLLLTLGQGRTATIEPTTRLSATPRLDQIAAVHLLAEQLITFHSPPSQSGNPHAPANTPGIRHIAFAVEDIDAVVAGLQARGLELVGEVVRYENSFRLCCVRGPAGIIVELAEKIG